VMDRLLFQNDPLWNEPGRPVLDLRNTALVEHENPRILTGVLKRPPEGESAGETIEVRPRSPIRLEIEANLAATGLVILADVHDPGWRLTIDGEPAPILRVNRLMRGAVVPAGRHLLVYTYRPLSVAVGAIGSLAGLGLLGVVMLRRPASRSPLHDTPTTEPGSWEPANRSSTPPTSASASREPT
jgi:hypothetical protein